jgi:hypothetical protein
MTGSKALERCETKVGKCEVTLQAVWPIPKSLIKMDGTKAPTAIDEPLGVTSPERERQRDCRLFRKPVHISKTLLATVDDATLKKVRLVMYKIY